MLYVYNKTSIKLLRQCETGETVRRDIINGPQSTPFSIQLQSPQFTKHIAIIIRPYGQQP
jgi:hypothetical protein